MEFSRQEYWSGLPFPSPEDDLPDPGIKPGSLALQADSLLSEPPGSQTSDFVNKYNACWGDKQEKAFQQFKKRFDSF